MLALTVVAIGAARVIIDVGTLSDSPWWIADTVQVTAGSQSAGDVSILGWTVCMRLEGAFEDRRYRNLLTTTSHGCRCRHEVRALPTVLVVTCTDWHRSTIPG